MRVTIYSKPECHLCDEAKLILKKVAADFPFTLREINIEEDPEVYEKYKYEIPVVFLEDVKLFKGRVDEKKLRKALSARQ